MPRRLLYCDELRKILGLPVPCGCEDFICEHNAPGGRWTIAPPPTLEELKRWHEAERHRYACRTCLAVARAERRAMTRPWREYERRLKLAERQDRPSRGGRP